MLRRGRRGPVAGEKDGEDHRSKKCIREAEAAPYPEGKDGAGGGNNGLGCVRSRRIMDAAEKGRPRRCAEKTYRANRERFLDAVAIEPGLGNGRFRRRVA